MSFEHDVYEWHKRGRLDANTVELFLPNGAIRNIEGPMWDYKVGFCLPRAIISDEAVLICDLFHSIASFYNAHGGYLIVAFKDADAASFATFGNKDDFDKLADRYLKSYIPVAPFRTKASLNGDTVNVLMIHVAKRQNQSPVYYRRNSAKKGNDYIFKTDDIPLRFGSSAMIINHRADLITFAFGERPADIGEIPTPLNEIDNNLPPRDPNLIEFIGRRQYLASLWTWLDPTLATPKASRSLAVFRSFA
jgi:hypothetical protein